MNCKNSWKAVRQCKLGNKNNHKKQKVMSLRLPNGQRAKTDKENMSVFQPHCIRIFNNSRIVSPKALNFITQHETYEQLDDPITWQEFMTAVNGMSNDKSPGANGVPAEAIKAMNRTNLQQVYNHINAVWNGSKNHAKWHTGNGTPVPKISNPDDPNKY
jgi:hypothetical protein